MSDDRTRVPGKRTRRTTLKSLGLIGATGVGLGTTQTVAAANYKWKEENIIYGQRRTDTGNYQDDYYHVFDARPKLLYHGYHEEDSGIAHTFTFSLVGHTYIGRYNRRDEMESINDDSGKQNGNWFTAEKPDGGSVEMTLGQTYPGRIGEDTDPTWTEVTQEDSDSWSKYKNEVEYHVGQDKDDETADVMAIAASTALAAATTTPGLGAAAALAWFLFKEAGDEDKTCGVEPLGNPQGYHYSFCQDSVPINIHHAELEIHAPANGETHWGRIEQGLDIPEKYLDESYYDCDNGFYWDLKLPGTMSNASLVDKGTFHADK